MSIIYFSRGLLCIRHPCFLVSQYTDYVFRLYKMVSAMRKRILFRKRNCSQISLQSQMSSSSYYSVVFITMMKLVHSIAAILQLIPHNIPSWKWVCLLIFTGTALSITFITFEVRSGRLNPRKNLF